MSSIHWQCFNNDVFVCLATVVHVGILHHIHDQVHFITQYYERVVINITSTACVALAACRIYGENLQWLNDIIACIFFWACLLIIIHTDVLHSRVLIYVSGIKRHGFTGQLPHSCIPTGTHGERRDGVGRDLRCKLIQGPLNTGRHTPPSPRFSPFSLLHPIGVEKGREGDQATNQKCVSEVDPHCPAFSAGQWLVWDQKNIDTTDTLWHRVVFIYPPAEYC